MSTTEQSGVTVFPLERPALRPRRLRTSAGTLSLPYFVAGEENRLVSFVARSESSVFDLGNPILLVGSTGCGKTAIALHLAARQSAAAPVDGEPSEVWYYAAIDFARQYAEAVAADDLPPLRTEIDEAAILVIDDLHLIADKPAAQEELALRIESRTLRRLATIVTCRRLPSEVRGLKSLLVSRVLPGLTIPIANPCGETRQLLLREMALHLGLDIDADLLEKLHEDLDRQLPARSLEAALKQIALWCRMNDLPATIDAVAAAVATVGKAEEVSLASIAAAVAKYFQLKLSELRSSSRKQNLVRARSLAMLLGRRMTTKSMHQIGDYFGGRDHTTVLHAIRKTESLLEEDSDLRRAADEVTEKLLAT